MGQPKSAGQRQEAKEAVNCQSEAGVRQELIIYATGATLSPPGTGQILRAHPWLLRAHPWQCFMAGDVGGQWIDGVITTHP